MCLFSQEQSGIALEAHWLTEPAGIDFSMFQGDSNGDKEWQLLVSCLPEVFGPHVLGIIPGVTWIRPDV